MEGTLLFDIIKQMEANMIRLPDAVNYSKKLLRSIVYTAVIVSGNYYFR